MHHLRADSAPPRSTQHSEDSPIARNTSPQTFEKRRRERDKQQKQAQKAAARRERNDLKKAIKDGDVEAPRSGPEIIDMASLQPMAFETPDEPAPVKEPKVKNRGDDRHRSGEGERAADKSRPAPGDGGKA